MSQKQIQLAVLKQAVANQGRDFATKDVSESKQMKDAHPDLVSHSHYHSFVGAALSQHHDILGIIEVRKGTSRGSRWEKNGLASPSIAATVDVPATRPSQVHSTELGPQYRKDAIFKARMRLHQSWYRANILRMPYGTGPKSTDTSHYGNMLTRPDGEAGHNFLTPQIAQTARDRVAQGGGAEPYRLFHDMLSSQPMCFNLFGPLVKDHVLACRLLSALVPETVAEVTRVAIEWAPQPAEAYLNDRTSFDAFIEYRTLDGHQCALGIETKLTEPFSQNEYDGERYRRWMRVQGTPWRPDAETTVHDIQHNQLWRDHLLAFAMRHQPDSPYTKTRLMVIYHPEDRDCAHVMSGYRKLLREDDDTLIVMPLDRLVQDWTTVIADGPQRAWIQDFHVRYLELERSAGCRGSCSS